MSEINKFIEHNRQELKKIFNGARLGNEKEKEKLKDSRNGSDGNRISEFDASKLYRRKWRPRAIQ